MPIVVSESVAERGKKDARRHREKHWEAVKDKLPELIGNESIITKRGNKTYKIPLKALDIPHFRPDRGDMQEGLGQGPGQPGDQIGHRPGEGQPNMPGQEPGEDYIEAEFDAEEIISLILEDCALPKLEDKDLREFTVEIGWKITGRSKSGTWSNVDRRATANEGIRRFWNFLEALKMETGLDDLTCFRALKQADGLLSDALEILKEKKITFEVAAVEPWPIYTNEDLRYFKIDEDTEQQSNAVIIAMMDVSGSMSDMKKYLARAMLFWLNEFLNRKYSRMVIRFIIHHSTARVVEEDDFFSTRESGGTNCYTAYEIANSLVETEYPTDQWNVYVWHFSDGEDGNSERTIEELEKLMNQGVNMVGYGEVKASENYQWFTSDSGLWNTFKGHFGLKEGKENGVPMMVGDTKLPLLCVRIEDRENLLPALKAFLRKDRWAQ